MIKKAVYILLSECIEYQDTEVENENYLPIFKKIYSQKIVHVYIKKGVKQEVIISLLNQLDYFTDFTHTLTFLLDKNREYRLFYSLVGWFDTWHRIMPWRTTPSLYGTWVSEIMLQQTQVVTVINYYNRFMKRFPTIFDLANANENEVLLYWQGLGYYSRARNLHKCAKIVVEKYNGVFPSDIKELVKLPGIGPYTSGAIRSIGYNQKASAIDGNVTRILTRVYAYTKDSKSKEAYLFYENMLERLLIDEYSKFNQALMDLGALICKGKKPNCLLCPIEPFCDTTKLKMTEKIPMILPKKSKVVEHYNSIIYKKNNTYFIEYRAGQGMLKNMWGTLLIEGSVISYQSKLQPIKHVFTHKIWKIQPYIVDYLGESLPKGEFVKVSHFQEFPIAKAFQKIIYQIQESEGTN
ncbi:MAG: A/G-specific adenine glycosylase [Fusobacteria bacterium]|nr:A/G-specific adenine glycosylase [Fusobacteriota bacterium]